MLKDFSYLSKSDRIIFIILLLLVIGVLVFMYLIGGKGNSTDVVVADSTAKDTTSQRSQTYVGGEEMTKSERFAFDPNTADSTQLLRLGLNKWQVRNIYKYRAAGGVYRQPSDFARLWGLTKKQYEELRPYIRISDDYKPAADFYGNTGRSGTAYTKTYQPNEQQERPAFQRQPKLEEGQTVNLNTADTAQLKMVPGIGSYFARQIVNYRKRLGGFSTTAQLMEILLRASLKCPMPSRPITTASMTSIRPRPSCSTVGCAVPSRVCRSLRPARTFRQSRSSGWNPTWNSEQRDL